jgi:hypothetical protein
MIRDAMLDGHGVVVVWFVIKKGFGLTDAAR